MQPYRFGSSLILDVQQIIALPEAADFQVQIQKKRPEVRASADQGADWTRYDVTTDEGRQQKLYKRQVMLAAVRQLVRHGKSLAEIQEAAGRDNMFAEADGNIDSAAFEAELMRQHPKDAKAAKRFFIDNDQLFHLDGKTYALTNQCSKTSMEASLDALKGQFDDYGFSLPRTD